MIGPLLVSDITIAACVDTDPANSHTSKGRVVINSKTVAVDSCISGRVVETYCGFFGFYGASMTPTPCSNGGTCENGLCAAPPPPPNPCANFVAPPEDACSKTTCDPVAGIITTQKIKCADTQFCDKYLEACVIKPSTPSPTDGQCAVYEKPIMDPSPHFHVKPCDRIVLSGTLGKLVITIIDVTPSPAVVVKMQANIYGNSFQRSIYLHPADGTANLYLSGYDAGLINLAGQHLVALKSSFSLNSKYVDLFSPLSCTDAFNMCASSVAFKNQCYTTCSPVMAKVSDDNSIFFSEFAPPYISAVSTPSGYSKAALLTQQLADCVRTKIDTIFGVSDKKPTTISYMPDTMGVGTICAEGGASSGNIKCFIGSNFADNVLADPNNKDVSVINEKIASYSSKAKQSECTEEFGFIGGGLSHEMGHQFALNNFSVLESEGLATFVELETASKTNQTKLICNSDGYILTNTGVNKPYDAWTHDTHFTGACFLRELRDTYGVEIFKKIFQKANSLPIGGYKLFKDIINPIVNDNFFDKVKVKYGFTDDPLMLQTRQYFFK